MSNNITPDPKRIREYIARIDALYDEQDAVRSASVAECKRVGERIKNVYAQAVEDGILKRVLRAAYVRLQLRRKIEEQRLSLEEFEMQEELDKIEQALHSFETTPLGMAMMEGD